MPASRKELLKARLNNVRSGRQAGPSLEEVLTRLTPDLLDWAPSEGMRTVKGQLVEILEIEIPLVTSLKQGRLVSDEEFSAAMGNPQSLEDLKSKLSEVRRGTMDYLDSLTDEELEEEVRCEPWFGSFWLPSLPRAEFFINVAAHELYHTGQLVSYLWSRSDNPYEW